MAADARPLGQLLLGQPCVLAATGDAAAQLDKLLRVVKRRIFSLRHVPHLCLLQEEAGKMRH